MTHNQAIESSKKNCQMSISPGVIVTSVFFTVRNRNSSVVLVVDLKVIKVFRHKIIWKSTLVISVIILISVHNILVGKMGKQRKTRKIVEKRFAKMKKVISPSDPRIKAKDRAEPKKKKAIDPHEMKIREVPQTSSALFFQYNTQLGPPYHILIDTNFINFSIKNKLDIIQNMMDCLYAKCIPYITDCVLGELEKLGRKYRVALRIIKDPRFERIACLHKGTYADDCIVQRVTQHKCYIVATNDKDLKRRIRKIPGVPIMYVAEHKFTIERMPDAYGAPKGAI